MYHFTILVFEDKDLTQEGALKNPEDLTVEDFHINKASASSAIMIIYSSMSKRVSLTLLNNLHLILDQQL